MLRLALRYEGQIRYFPMPDREVRLGAAAENDLAAPFPGISRYHARLRPEGHGVRIADLGSTNGLVRDGRRLDEVLLTPGKTIRLGHAILTVEEVASSDAEIGLELRVLESKAGSLPAGDTASLLPASGSSPAKALRFVRVLERAGAADAVEHIGPARRALGATSLRMVDHRSPGGPALLACAGPLPERIEDSDGETLQHSSGGKGLIAQFDAAPEPWQHDLFAYLSDKLLPAGSSERSADEPAADDVLRLPPGMVVGSSVAMQDLLAQLRGLSRSDLSVLLLGETGTGKELVARLIHDSGRQARGPFVAINCAAIPSELLEAELFGIAGRVATGVDPRTGLFVQAHGGTLFLDEVGDMPERLQAKLLRALQEREVLPLGGSSPRKIDVRIIAASNRDLGRLVKEGLYRADLYYRLRGIELRLPPLRERVDDLPALVLAFVSRAAVKYGKRIRGVSRGALSTLLASDWPGNVRELENVIERAVLLCPSGGTLQREHIGTLEPLAAEPVVPAPLGELSKTSPTVGTLQEQVAAVERAAILRALAAADGNKSKAARLLGITRNGLSLKIERLKIDPPSC